MSNHDCNITWCEQGSGSNEPHWCSIAYTPATMNWVAPEDVSVNGYMFPSVGAGIRWDEQTGTPAVYVHISGGERDIDEDAYLRLDEADALLSALQDAIGLARETLAGGHRTAAE